ncbi:MAG: adenylate/guanylate cyclase domain-containing protein, partial [Candidatus Levyibacteriota bacterium]
MPSTSFSDPSGAPLPAGTVTFLFTDIEGSTRLWESQQAAMQAALPRHDALLRQCIARHDGHVFKTGGDAFFAAFHTAADAVAAALEAQRALHVEPWPDPVKIRVRMALHTGAVEYRDGDYF